MVADASAVPEMLSELPDARTSETSVGARGATVSTVTFSAAEAPLTLPAASTALLAKACVPSDNVPLAKVQLLIDRGSADLDRSVVYPDGTAHVRGPGQNHLIGVGYTVACDIAVGRERSHVRRRRCNRVDSDADVSRGTTEITAAVRGDCREHVSAIA